MNDKIKDLAEQARKIGEYGNYGQIRLSPAQFEQKFAELIVKECCRIVNLWTDEDLPEGREDVFQTIWIKKTFGIEE